MSVCVMARQRPLLLGRPGAHTLDRWSTTQRLPPGRRSQRPTTTTIWQMGPDGCCATLSPAIRNGLEGMPCCLQVRRGLSWPTHVSNCLAEGSSPAQPEQATFDNRGAGSEPWQPVSLEAQRGRFHTSQTQPESHGGGGGQRQRSALSLSFFCWGERPVLLSFRARDRQTARLGFICDIKVAWPNQPYPLLAM